MDGLRGGTRPSRLLIPVESRHLPSRFERDSKTVISGPIVKNCFGFRNATIVDLEGYYKVLRVSSKIHGQ